MLNSILQYKPLFKGDTLKLGTHLNIAIVTGWTPVDVIARNLFSSDYAVIGNLYNPAQGINYLVRNLLYNPQIHYLLALSVTRQDDNSGSIECLRDFFENGVTESTDMLGRKLWQIISPFQGYIDGDIPLTAIHRIRKNVAFVKMNSAKALCESAKALSFDILEPWGTPREFPYSQPDMNLTTSDRIGYRFSGSLPEVWVKILHSITKYGREIPTRFGISSIELIDVMAVIDVDTSFDVYPDYLPVSLDAVKQYLPEMLTPSPSGAKYNYGSRLRSHFDYDQLSQIIDSLLNNPGSRSAVASLWDVNDYYTGEPPCLTNIWCRIVDDKLTMTAIFRSHDIYNAWVQNAFGLRELQRHIVDRINNPNLKVGELTILSQSAHIYTDTLAYAQGIVSTQYPKITQKDILRYKDDIGNFLIETIKGYITVYLNSPDGKHLKTYTGSSALKLGREITSDNPHIDPSHALYLGTELQKAEEALVRDENYLQT